MRALTTGECFLQRFIKFTRQNHIFDQIHEENIDGLDIYWFVTFDKTNRDLPGYVEGLLMQNILMFTASCRHGIKNFKCRGTVHPCPIKKQ